MRDYLEFAYYMLRPRAVRAWWRLGSFECANWSYDYHCIQWASHSEQFKRALAEL